MKDFEIVNRRVDSVMIGEDGNWYYDNDGYKCFLINDYNEIISRKYECIFYLGADHFAVCNLVPDVEYLMDSYSSYDKYYNIVHGEYKVSKTELKWGVIRVNRNIKGYIIPNSEVLVIPCIYGRISPSNLMTAIAYNKGKLTYLDLDKDSENYGHQLVPCILEHAVPFSTRYEGFAECGINGNVGFLPRNCRVKELIDGNELLSDSQISFLFKYFNSEEGFILDDKTISAYLNLTGIDLLKNKKLVLKK